MGSVFIESNLFDILRSENSIDAEIIEIEKNIITAESEYGCIVVLNDRNYIGPMSIAVEEVLNFKEHGIRESDNLALNADSLEIGNRVSIDISKIEPVDLRVQFKEKKMDEAVMSENLLKLEEQLYILGKRSGMLPVVFNIGDYIKDLESGTEFRMYNNMYSSLIFTRVLSLFEKLIQGRFEKAEHCVKDIIDIGTENNNYSNGFLLGILSAFVYGGKTYGLNEDGIVTLNESLIKGVSIDTQNLYHNMLMESVDGGSPKAILTVLEVILFNEDDEILENAVKELLKIDSISGTDVLCGIYFGLRLLEKEKFRESIESL